VLVPYNDEIARTISVGILNAKRPDSARPSGDGLAFTGPGLLKGRRPTGFGSCVNATPVSIGAVAVTTVHAMAVNRDP